MLVPTATPARKLRGVCIGVVGAQEFVAGSYTSHSPTEVLALPPMT